MVLPAGALPRPCDPRFRRKLHQRRIRRSYFPPRHPRGQRGHRYRNRPHLDRARPDWRRRVLGRHNDRHSTRRLRALRGLLRLTHFPIADVAFNAYAIFGSYGPSGPPHAVGLDVTDEGLLHLRIATMHHRGTGLTIAVQSTPTRARGISIQAHTSRFGVAIDSSKLFGGTTGHVR